MYDYIDEAKTIEDRADWDEELKPPDWHYPEADPRPDYIEMKVSR